MRYLGAMSGSAALMAGDTALGRAEYEFDAYLKKVGEVSCSGEIRMAAGDLEAVFGRRDLALLTDDGRRLDVRFSEKALKPDADAAHVDVTGDLPTDPAAWRA